MCGSTFLLGLSSFNHQNTGKISRFVYLSHLSLSLSLSNFFSFLFPFASLLFSLFYFIFPFLLPYPLNFPLFVCSHPISFSSFLSFSHLFLFLFSFFSFLFSFLFLIWIASTEWSKSKGNFPPLSSIATCHHHYFSYKYMIFLFPLFPSFDTWHDHVYRPTSDASKNGKFQLSQNLTKFVRVIKFHEMNSMVKSVSSSEI